MNTFGLSSQQHDEIRDRFQKRYGEHGNAIYTDLFTPKGNPNWFAQRKNIQLFLDVMSSQMRLGIPVFEAIGNLGAILQTTDSTGANEMQKLQEDMKVGGDIGSLFAVRIAQYSKTLAQHLCLLPYAGSLSDSVARVAQDLKTQPFPTFAINHKKRS